MEYNGETKQTHGERGDVPVDKCLPYAWRNTLAECPSTYLSFAGILRFKLPSIVHDWSFERNSLAKYSQATQFYAIYINASCRPGSYTSNHECFLRNSETYPEGAQPVFSSPRIPAGCGVAAEASIVNNERAELADRPLEAISRRQKYARVRSRRFTLRLTSLLATDLIRSGGLRAER